MMMMMMRCRPGYHSAVLFMLIMYDSTNGSISRWLCNTNVRIAVVTDKEVVHPLMLLHHRCIINTTFYRAQTIQTPLTRFFRPVFLHFAAVTQSTLQRR